MAAGFGLCGWLGMAVAVHAAAAGPPPASPSHPPSAVTAGGGLQPLGFVLPARRTGARSPTLAPPELPPGAAALPPMTFTVLVEGPAGGPLARQRISRTAEAMHIAVEGTGEEWYFERNPRDPRRTAAYRVVHAQRTLVVYDDTDLRTRYGIAGWRDVVTLGVDPAALVEAGGPGEDRVVGEVRFARRLLADASGQPGVELWWSDALLLPAATRVTGEVGPLRTEISDLVQGVDAARMALPHTRFPAYRVVDVADWGEHH